MRVRAALLTCIALVCAGAQGGPAHASLTGSPAVVASGLQYPWDVLSLPDGRTLVTERPGRVRVIGANGSLAPGSVFTEAGATKFLGMAIDPDYARNRFVYLYITRSDASRVIRLTDTGSALTAPATIYGGIGTDGSHDGGRIAFGPDRMLYVTTGDIHNPDLPRDLGSPNGKILRMTAAGAPAPGNPFSGAGARPYVWSYGHRHPQGIGWDAQGRMWESEHGPSGELHAPAGAKSGNDEINRIDRGADYGWPDFAGDQTAPGVRTPVAHASNSPAWAPGGLAFGPDRVLYVPFLAGKELRAFTTSGDAISGQASLFAGTFGRLRAATADATHLWLTTSNDTNDEKVLRVAFNPATIPPAPAPGAGGGVAALTRAQLRKIVRDILARQARALRSKRARKLAKVSRLRLRDRVLPAGRMSISVDRPGIRRKRSRVRILGGKSTTRAGRRAAVTTKLSRKSRRLLRKAARRKGRLKLTLRVGLRTTDKRLTTGRRTITIRRR